MLNQSNLRTIFTACAGVFIFASLSFGQIHWTQRNPLPMGMSCVTWAGDKFVAVGAGVFTSPDGVNWSIIPDAPSGLSSVVWTGSRLVAVGGSDAYTSPDGTGWTKRSTGTTFVLFEIAWTGEQLAAVGSGGVILTSPDGETWTTRVTGSGSGVWLYSVGWTGKMLVATGVGLVRTSTDGISWDAFNGPTSSIITYIASTDNVTIIAGGFNDTRFYTSLSGGTGTWPAGYGGFYSAGVWSGTLVVAVGGDGAIATSPDGTVWTGRESGITGSLSSVAWNGTMFVAVGGSGFILTSPDGIVWTSRGTPSIVDVMSVAWMNNQYIAIGFQYESPNAHIHNILSSPDGVKWTAHAFPDNQNVITSVTWTGSQYAAVSGYDKIFTSPDGITWKTIMVGDNSIYFRSITWTGTKLVAVGFDYPKDSCAIFTSTDGISWKETVLEMNTFLFKIIWTGTKLVGVGYESGYFGAIRISEDGENWSSFTGDLKATLWDAAYNGKNIVAVGDSGSIYASFDDGETWQRQSCGSTNNLNAVTWTGNQFVLVDGKQTGSIFTSPDGIKWIKREPETPLFVNSIAWANKQIIAVGNEGLITTSCEDIVTIKNRYGTVPFSSPDFFTVSNSNKAIKVTMANDSRNRDYTVRIFTIAGKCIRSMKSQATSEITISLKGIAPGSYIVQVGTKGARKTFPFIYTNLNGG